MPAPIHLASGTSLDPPQAPPRELEVDPTPLPPGVVAHGRECRTVRPGQGRGYPLTGTGPTSVALVSSKRTVTHRRELSESQMLGNGTSGSAGGLGQRICARPTPCRRPAQCRKGSTGRTGATPPLPASPDRDTLTRVERCSYRTTRQMDRDAPLPRPRSPREEPPDAHQGPEQRTGGTASSHKPTTSADNGSCVAATDIKTKDVT